MCECACVCTICAHVLCNWLHLYGYMQWPEKNVRCSARLLSTFLLVETGYLTDARTSLADSEHQDPPVSTLLHSEVFNLLLWLYLSLLLVLVIGAKFSSWSCKHSSRWCISSDPGAGYLIQQLMSELGSGKSRAELVKIWEDEAGEKMKKGK